MHPRNEEILNYLNQRRTELRAAVDSVRADARNTQPAANQWSVAQVLDHLTIVHTRVAAAVTKWIAQAQADGLGPETATTSVLNTIPTERILDRSRKVAAPETIVPRADVDCETAWAELEQSHEQLRAALLSGDGLALEQIVKPHPALGPINLYQWILFEGSHEARHTLQVREIAQKFAAIGEATASGRG